jgi:MFS family permease
VDAALHPEPAPPVPKTTNVLRRVPAFRRLWLARGISHIGDGAALVALVLYVKGTGRGGLSVGALLLAQALPRFLGPIAGSLADRVDRRRLMIGCDLGQAAVFTAIVAWRPPFVYVLVLVVATALLDTTFGPASSSAVPLLVAPPDLIQANAWMGTTLNLQVAVGPFLGGLLVSLLGVRAGLLANAASFVLSAAFLARLPALTTAVADQTTLLGETRAGLAYVWRSPLLRALVLSLFLGVAFAAVDNVALVFLTQNVLGAGAFGYGAVAAAFGVGMLAGSIALSWRPPRRNPYPLLLWGWALVGAGTLFTGLAPAIGAAVGAQAIGGLGNGLQNIASDTLVQQNVPGHMLGRVFGLVSTAAFGGSALAYAGGGVLLEATSPRATFVIAACGVCAVLVFLIVVLGANPARTSTLERRG